MSPDARLMTQLADRSLSAQLPIQRDRFVEKTVTVVSAAAKSGGFTGSGYREHIHKLCAAELHGRAELLGDAIRAAHKGISGAPSDAMLTAAKDWIAERIAQEAGTFDAFLWKPNESFGEKGEPENLNDEARREADAVSASLDKYWETLRHDRAERAVRWITRAVRWVRSLSHGIGSTNT